MLTLGSVQKVTKTWDNTKALRQSINARKIGESNGNITQRNGVGEIDNALYRTRDHHIYLVKNMLKNT